MTYRLISIGPCRATYSTCSTTFWNRVEQPSGLVLADPGEYSADFSSQVEKLGLPVESVKHATDNWVALESTEMGWVGHASRPELAWFAGDG